MSAFTYPVRRCGLLLQVALALLFPWAAPAQAGGFTTVVSTLGVPYGLSADHSGNLFGVFSAGGKGTGEVYELNHGKRLKIIYKFVCTNRRQGDCPEGDRPVAPLVIDVAGNVYGTTTQGGLHGEGAAFELLPSAPKWTYRKLYDFCSQTGCADGADPSGALTYAGAEIGALYDGTSPLFGVTRGTAYQLVPGGRGWSESVIYQFCSQGGSNCTDGNWAQAGFCRTPKEISLA